jgi:hypothetical protein
MRDMRFILQRRSARASVHFAMGVGILFWNVQSAQCEQPGTPAEVKQPATAHARSRPSTTSDGSAQLLSAILGGVESCAQDVVTGEFEAMETTGVSSAGTAPREISNRIRCVFDRRGNRVRHEVLVTQRSSGQRPKTDSSQNAVGAPAARHTIVIRRPDLSAQWIESNKTIVLHRPETVYEPTYLRPLDPMVAGLLTAGEVSRHESFKRFRDFLSARRDKNEVTATSVGQEFRLAIHYQKVAADGTVVETERQTWVDPGKRFAPSKTEMRQRTSKGNRIGEWSAPQITEVQWTDKKGVFVPLSIVASLPIHSHRTITTRITLEWKHVNDVVDDHEFDYLALSPDSMVVDQRIGNGNPAVPTILRRFRAPSPDCSGPTGTGR